MYITLKHYRTLRGALCQLSDFASADGGSAGGVSSVLFSNKLPLMRFLMSSWPRRQLKKAWRALLHPSSVSSSAMHSLIERPARTHGESARHSRRANRCELQLEAMPVLRSQLPRPPAHRNAVAIPPSELRGKI